MAKRLLGLGLGGAAVALLPQLGGHAGASTPPGTGDAESAASTTTTSAPKRPTPADVDRLVFAQAVEISAYVLYKQSYELPFDEDQRTVIEVIGQSHLAYAQALSGFLGRQASNDPDQAVVDELSSAFSADVDTMMQAAYELESALVSTHIETISNLIGTDAVNLLSSMVTVEGRNGTVLADLMGSDDFAILLIDDEADAFAPAEG